MAGCSFLRILRDTWQAIPILCASPSLLLLKFTAQTHLLPNPFVHEDTVSNQREGCPLRATEVARLDPIRNTAILEYACSILHIVFNLLTTNAPQNIHDFRNSSILLAFYLLVFAGVSTWQVCSYRYFMTINWHLTLWSSSCGAEPFRIITTR